jgi:Mn2+/Fe2+ NRAMP family transporter
MAVCALLVTMGGFKWLDRLMTIVVVLLALCTVVATAMVLDRVDFSGPFWPDSEAFEGANVLFIAALIGWMPAAIDVSVWHSLWTLAKKRTRGHAPTIRQSMFDFNVGYVGAAILAICFLLLGAGVMDGEALHDTAPGFANQVVNLYVATLGEWSGPLIGLCAFLVMFSTALTVIDGFPRALACLVRRLRAPEEEDEELGSGPAYQIGVIVLVVGALMLLIGLVGRAPTGGLSFRDLIDVAITLSLVTAPVLAILNHRAVLSAEIAPELRPSRPMVIFSWVGIGSLSAFCAAFFILRFG